MLRILALGLTLFLAMPATADDQEGRHRGKDTCGQLANDKGLKGRDRERFMKECTQAAKDRRDRGEREDDHSDRGDERHSDRDRTRKEKLDREHRTEEKAEQGRTARDKTEQMQNNEEQARREARERLREERDRRRGTTGNTQVR